MLPTFSRIAGPVTRDVQTEVSLLGHEGAALAAVVGDHKLGVVLRGTPLIWVAVVIIIAGLSAAELWRWRSASVHPLAPTAVAGIALSIGAALTYLDTDPTHRSPYSLLPVALVWVVFTSGEHLRLRRTDPRWRPNVLAGGWCM